MQKNKKVKFFFPDYTPEQLRALGVMDHKGIKPLYASQGSWPKHWVKEDKTGWGGWYDKYSKGRRHADDDWQKSRWHSFKARHGAEFLRQPTPKRAFALINWAIDPIKFLKKNGVDHTELEAAMKNHRQKIDAILDKTAAHAKPRASTFRSQWDSSRFVKNRFNRKYVVKNPFKVTAKSHTSKPKITKAKGRLIKAAMDKRILGSAFGTALGTIPGLLTYDKKNKSKSLGRILLGAGTGMTLGNIGGIVANKGDYPSIIDIQKNITKRPFGNIIAASLGSFIGAIPGIIDVKKTFEMQDGEDKKVSLQKAFGKIFIGGGIGGAILGGNSVLKNISKKRK